MRTPFKDPRVVMFCDNTAVIEMLNKSISSCKRCMKLIILITLECLRQQARIFSTYIRTDKSILADALSRLQFDRFWKHCDARMDSA